jgi:ABC-type phosphate transport system auxiliary subunit
VILKIIVATAVVIALIAAVGVIAIRGLRKFVRSVWPHS